GYQNVPAVQEKIIQTAHKWHKEVIVATEMLMSSINSDKPSCADVSDVYFALLQGADYVMLSEETALGEPKVAVSIMKEIILSFENRKTVFTYGAFDILHPGHIRLLKRASKLGDKLIVGLVSDESVRELKGATRPAMSLEDRMELISAIRYVDEVYVMDSYDPVPLMKNLNINILTKGNDWDIIPGQEYAARMGIKIVKLSYSKHFSTSKLFEKIASFKNDDSSVNDVPEHQRVKDILATSKK
ncbi:MAG: adenylyltransferase/cytidyltransferase family protein, partial [Candidatus Heimdallarchaeota archaeon]|nr:adenylyltransferase/cytidyltransferase family protein [Candidatus Heimdallarchaeota archaeon]